MAIYHAKVQTISRKAGRSSVASAAYRGGLRLEDERTGDVHDYTRRKGVEESAQFGWQGERAELWNRAEAMERRWDSRVAREAVVALPKELSREAQVELVQEFAAELRNRYGVAGSWDLHAPSRASEYDDNWHAHIMWTTRQVDEAGAFGAKTRDLDNAKTSWVEVDWIRERWEVRCNDALETDWHERSLNGMLSEEELWAGPAKVDRRTRQAQGLEGAPLHHLTPAEVALERRGVLTVRAAENQDMKADRKARLAATERIAQTQQPTHQEVRHGGVEAGDRRGMVRGAGGAGGRAPDGHARGDAGSPGDAPERRGGTAGPPGGPERHDAPRERPALDHVGGGDPVASAGPGRRARLPGALAAVPPVEADRRGARRAPAGDVPPERVAGGRPGATGGARPGHPLAERVDRDARLTLEARQIDEEVKKAQGATPRLWAHDRTIRYGGRRVEEIGRERTALGVTDQERAHLAAEVRGMSPEQRAQLAQMYPHASRVTLARIQEMDAAALRLSRSQALNRGRGGGRER